MSAYVAGISRTGKCTSTPFSRVLTTFLSVFHEEIRAVDYLGVSMITQILTVPVYVVVFVATISMALSSDHHIERGLHYAGPVVVSAVGYILIVTEDSSPVWHIGLPVATAGSFSSVPAM